MSKPYRPANGTDGMIFQERWCANCIHEAGDNECSILTRTMVHDVDDDEYPAEWQEAENGPICSAFNDGSGCARCPNTPDLLEVNDGNNQP